MLFLVLCRLFYIQIIWGEDLQKKAIDQWTREIPIIAQRGLITDCNGVVLSRNNDTYTVFVRKRAVGDFEKLCLVLSEQLSLSYDYVVNRLTKTSSSEVTIKKQVPNKEV